MKKPFLEGNKDESWTLKVQLVSYLRPAVSLDEVVEGSLAASETVR